MGKKNDLCLSIWMDCIHLSKDFLLVFNVPEIMCLVFECSPPRKAVSHSSNYHIPKGSWLMISLWTTWSFSFCALPEQFPTQWSILGSGWILNTQGIFWKWQLFRATSQFWAWALENSNSRVGCEDQQWVRQHSERGKVAFPASGQAEKLRLLQWHMQQVDVFKGCIIL